MDYVKKYFGKELNELVYDDVQDFFIEEKDESDKIEYKSYFSDEKDKYEDKLNAVIKTICALLNSEGGLIIWGAPIGQKVTGKKEKIFKGELSPVNVLIEKDSFIRKITEVITTSPHGVRFKPLTKDDAKFVYVIEVEKSQYSPHQFKNNYFMRLDGQTKIAPHHYVEALFRKVTYPNLSLLLEQVKFEKNGNNPTYQLRAIIQIANNTKLQNERDVKLILTTSHCKSEIFAFSNLKYKVVGNGKVIVDVIDTLHYGNVLRESFNFQIHEDELTENKNINLELSIGGRYSPLMNSLFEIIVNNNGGVRIDRKLVNNLVVIPDED